MSSKAPSHTTQTTEVKLPAWVEEASKSNYDFAKMVAGRPLVQYEGPQVADLSSMTTDAFGLLKKNIGASDPLYQAAYGLQGDASDLQKRAAAGYESAAHEFDPLYAKGRGLYDRSAGVLGKAERYLGKSGGYYDASKGYFDRGGRLYDEAAGMYRKSAGPLDVGKYLNPYTEEVESNAIRNAERSLASGMMSVGDAARKGGAFGGSRSAVQLGVLGAEGARGIGDLSAQLRAAGYDKATADMMAHRQLMQGAAAGLGGAGAGQFEAGRGIQGIGAGLGNVAAGLMSNAAGLQGAGGGMLSNIAQQQQGRFAGAGGMLSSAGGLLSSATGIGETARGRQESVMKDVAGLTAAGATEQAHRQAQIDADMKKFYEKRDYPLEQLNTLLASLGMSPYGKTETATKTGTSESQGTDWATTGLGILKTLPALFGMFSDRRDKTDIKRVGKDPSTKLPMYSYRYKGDPKSYPKVVGPMAQDVEKKFPDQVFEIAGHKVVKPAVMRAVGVLAA